MNYLKVIQFVMLLSLNVSCLSSNNTEGNASPPSQRLLGTWQVSAIQKGWNPITKESEYVAVQPGSNPGDPHEAFQIEFTANEMRIIKTNMVHFHVSSTGYTLIENYSHGLIKIHSKDRTLPDFVIYKDIDLGPNQLTMQVDYRRNEANVPNFKWDVFRVTRIEPHQLATVSAISRTAVQSASFLLDRDGNKEEFRTETRGDISKEPLHEKIICDLIRPSLSLNARFERKNPETTEKKDYFEVRIPTDSDFFKIDGDAIAYHSHDLFDSFESPYPGWNVKPTRFESGFCNSWAKKVGPMVEVNQQCVRSGIEKTITEITFSCVLRLSEFSPGGAYYQK